MAQTLLTVNAEVPYEAPSAPVLAVFDNGDWEVAFAGDVDHIAEVSNSFLGSTPIVEVLNELLLLNDEDTLEVLDDRVTLFVSLTVPVNAPTEPVVMIWEDGSTEIMDRGNAEALIEVTDEAHNFVPLADLFEELRSWLSYHADELFDDGDAGELNFDEENEE